MRSPWRAAALAGAATMPPRRAGGHSTDHRRQASSGLAALAGGGGLLCRGLARSLLGCGLRLLGGRLLRRRLLFGLFRRVLALGRRALLALDALLEQRHEVDHVGGGVGVRGLLFLQRGGDALALEPLLD